MLPRASPASGPAPPDDFIASQGAALRIIERADARPIDTSTPHSNHPQNQPSQELPMWSNHPHVVQQLGNDRQDRLRQLSQRTRLLHDVKRSRRQQHIKT